MWKTLDGIKYYFDQYGILKTGWVREGSDWRYIPDIRLL